MTALRLGTRRSPLALAQSRLVAAALELAGAGLVELVEISTLGDVSSQPLTELGGTGVFVSALRDALTWVAGWWGSRSRSSIRASSTSRRNASPTSGSRS